MFYTIITSTPIYICSILSILLALSLTVKWDRARFRLLVYMITAAAIYVGHYAYFNRTESIIPVTDTIFCFCNPAVFPLFLIYIEALVLKEPNHKRELLYLLPSLVCGISAAIIYATISDEELATFIGFHLYDQSFSSLNGSARWLAIIHIATRIIIALEIPPVIFFGWRYISDYNKMVENNYSNTEDKVVTLIKPLLIAFVAASLFSFICNLIGNDYFADSAWVLSIPVMTFSALILWFGFVGLTQNIFTREVVEESAKMEEEELEEELFPLTPEKEQIMASEIQKLMDEKQLFLQPNLKINDLANILNTNRNYIYNAINQGIGMSFAEYVNKKRIEYAVQLINQDRETLLTDVASKSGFASSSAFYRNFKLYMDCSPSDYQKKRNEHRCQPPSK